MLAERFRWLPILLLLPLSLGCGAPILAKGSAQERPAGLRLVLSADRTVYARGEPVELTLAVTNPGPTPITLTAPSSQRYDFTVLKDGAAIWRWSAGRMFLTVLTDLTIPPGETRAFTETWDQRDQSGQPVGPGEYVVVGTLIGGERVGLTLQRLRITIR